MKHLESAIGNADGSAITALSDGTNKDQSLVDQLLPRVDKELLPLLPAIQEAIDARVAIPVLSQWRFIRFLPLLASHLHLRWPGRISGLALSPRIGLYPVFGEQDQYLRSIYSVRDVQNATRSARTYRVSLGNGNVGPYPDWEQAIDRNNEKVGSLTLPAMSYLSIDRVTSTGEIKQGTRKILGRFVPRHQPKPRILIPGRSEISRAQVRGFFDLDLIIVNVQNVGGKQLAQAIAFFLQEIPTSAAVIILASSPAELVALNLGDATAARTIILQSDRDSPTVKIAVVGRDRALADRQFSFALDGLDSRGPLMKQLTVQATRTWWAVRQAISFGEPRETQRFITLLNEVEDAASRFDELSLFTETVRLISEQATRSDLRAERREQIISAVLSDNGDTQLIVVRSDGAAAELRRNIATALGVSESDLVELGILVQSVFSPWPDVPFDRCICAGYFGNRSLDAMFASGAKRVLLIADPIEARVALFDVERKYRSIPHLPERLQETLTALVNDLEPVAAPIADVNDLLNIFHDHAESRQNQTTKRDLLSRAPQILLFFTDGSNLQISSNSRMEVLGRSRLRLQSVLVRDLEIGDQVVLLNEEEREAFSERLLNLLDQTVYKEDSDARRHWLTLLQAVQSARPLSATRVKEGLAILGFVVDITTIRSWLPIKSIDGCGVPERRDVYLALASVLGLTLGNQLLLQWFNSIERLRKRHRRVGRDLARAIRGAYLGRLDPLSIARMEKEWGMEAKALLEAARVSVIDDLIPLGVNDGYD
jgi:hypothetical protein